MPPGPLTGALGHLRRAGLDPAVNAGLKGNRELLDQLRTKTAQAAGISVPELAALLIAVTVVGVLASASPAGGGMGVAEAGLILALTAGGITKVDATAAVFVQRLFSAYLPPVAGWLTLIWMRRREYL